jgi:hypothetical protein
MLDLFRPVPEAAAPAFCTKKTSSYTCVNSLRCASEELWEVPIQSVDT